MFQQCSSIDSFTSTVINLSISLSLLEYIIYRK
uniref:Uncharacterized protein n=1 Tax=viral metagenome TaxID=1070528 RepID=A0A6C0BLK5_9ZZZZ